MVGSNQKRKFVEEFDDVLAAAFDDGVPLCSECGFVGICRAIAPVISDEFSVASLMTKLVGDPVQAEVGGAMISATLCARLQLRRSLCRKKAEYTGFLQIFSILPLPQLWETLGR